MSKNGRQPVRRMENGRLVYYAQRADAGFWDSHWKNTLTKNALSWAEKGSLGDIETPLIRHLPRKGRILEAGCGTGGYVIALRKRGYNVEGIEYAQETVKRINRLYPKVPIRFGDIRALDVPDGYYDAYISLGVMEHCKDGPERFLREAHRVLRPKGLALISVPYFHILRRIKGWMGLFNNDPLDLDFYQYAFYPREIRTLIEKAGFMVVACYSYDPVKGIKDEVAVIRKVFEWGYFGHYLRRAIERTPYLTRFFGHMYLVVAERIS